MVPLFNVTVVLSVTIRPQFAIECLRAQINRGWVTLNQHFQVFPWRRPLTFGSAHSAHLWLTNREIIFEELQLQLQLQPIPTYVITIHQRHRQTDGQTDRQTTCDRKTAFCTKVR